MHGLTLLLNSDKLRHIASKCVEDPMKGGRGDSVVEADGWVVTCTEGSLVEAGGSLEVGAEWEDWRSDVSTWVGAATWGPGLRLGKYWDINCELIPSSRSLSERMEIVSSCLFILESWLVIFVCAKFNWIFRYSFWALSGETAGPFFCFF